MSITSIGGASNLFGMAGTGGGVAPKSGADQAGGQSAVDEFLSLAKMTPGERMRASILQSMGLNEDDLKGMSPEKRKAVEDMIQQKIKTAAIEAAKSGKTGLVADVTA